MTVAFTPSQLSNTEATSPIIFRKSPLLLFWFDLRLIIRLLRYSIQIILPLNTSNKNGELYLWNYGNIVSMILHSCLFMCSLFGVLLAPAVFLLLPGIGFVVFVLAVTSACAICD